MVPGAGSKFGSPMFEPEVFQKKMNCIEKVLVALLGFLGAAHRHSAPGKLHPLLPPLVTPLVHGPQVNKCDLTNLPFSFKEKSNAEFTN